VININLHPTLHRFQIMAISQIFASERRVPHFNALGGTGSDPLWISP